MKKNPPRAAGQAASLLLAVCLLSGCTALLERSYSVVEPYADRYWDSGAEDTLRVDNYQDLVNSLLLLVEEHAEEGVIRCYGESWTYQQARAAREEVRRETTLGSYLLKDLLFDYESGTNYSTITCTMSYREDAEDVSSLITISDSQSLVDLLRLAVREELEKQTARFSYDTPREDVLAAVEGLWQEMCQAEMEQQATLEADLKAEEDGQEAEPEAESEADSPEGEPNAQAEEPSGEPEENTSEEDLPDDEEPSADNPAEEPEPVVYPPCPWQIKYYPDNATAEIVEVILKR